MPGLPVKRELVMGLVLVVFLLLGLHAYNFVRLDAGQLAASVEPVLERARAISERAHPDYQDLSLARLAPNPHNGPFYRFDDNLHQAKVVGPQPKVSLEEDLVIDGFEFDDPAAKELAAADAATSPLVEQGMLRFLDHNGEDYLTNVKSLAIPKNDVGDILIRARTSRKGWMTLAWSKEERPTDIWRTRVDTPLVGDSTFHTYVINGRNVLGGGLGQDEKLTRVFLRPTNVAGSDIEIDFIRFLSRDSAYLSPNGVDYVAIGGEMRQALYMRPDQTLDWQVEIPTSNPVLEFGNGVVLDNRPTSFELVILNQERNGTLHAATIASADRWHDFRIDLARWAGQRVTVRFHVAGDAGNVGLWSSPLLHSRPQSRFNVIIVLEDALRADYLSTYGYELETSPHKTALMRDVGIQFDWAFSQATKTRASVPSLMTSLYPTTTGVWHAGDMLSSRYLTLAEIMRAQGFITASFLQNANAGPYVGAHQGFSELYEERIMGQATEEIVGQRVSSWLERHRGQNIFLYLHVIDPHGPYDPPAPFDSRYREVAGTGTPVKWRDDQDPSTIQEPTVEGRQRRYAGEIRHNDHVLTSLVHTLEELGIREDTLLIFLADHGEYMGEHGEWGHQPPGLMPVIRVPLMMIYPSRFKEPKRIADVVQLVDVMPTVLELAGIDRSELLLQGDSLISLIDGIEPERWRARLAISEEPHIMQKHRPCSCASLLSRDWHVISSTGLWPPNRDSPILPGIQTFVKTHVYAYRSDLKEQMPALSFLPDLYIRWLANDTISRLREADQTTWRKLTEGENVDLQVDPDTLEHLRGLGYVN
jgi:arylsulfatase A-like enzyme